MKNTVKIGSLVLLLIFVTTTGKAQNNTQERVYIKIEIKGLACPYCAFGMEKELKKVSGVDDNVTIELKEGLAFISTPIDQKPTKRMLKEIITNAGFTAGDITFSGKPFKKADN